jgi:branched-chain amino acid aminotransferase
VPIQPVDKIWMDGTLVDWDDARVHVLSHGLHYGSGVFEGIRAYDTEIGPAVFRLDDHIHRLVRSAALYQIKIPFSEEQLRDAVRETIAANGLAHCYIRPLVYLGYGEMGLNPFNAPVNVSIAVWPWGAYLGEDALESGVRIKVSSWKRNDQNSLPPAAKASGQYINSILAKMEALQGGYDEAIMLSYSGYIADGSGENVFVVRDGELQTPHLASGCLGGITRDSVMKLAGDNDIPVKEENLVRTDLYNADEAFFTGTAAEVTPIREMDDRTVGEGRRGPVTKLLQDAFFAAAHAKDERYRHWLTPVG